MEELRALTYSLQDAIQNDPLSCCCVPFQQNARALPAPPECTLPSRRLPLSETGQRIMGQQYVNLDGFVHVRSELYPGPARPVPQMKAELRGGRHFPACLCAKRNGLQDSCPSWRCMLAFHRRGCASLPFPTCGLGRRQLARYAALPDRTPEYCRRDQPPC